MCGDNEANKFFDSCKIGTQILNRKLKANDVVVPKIQMAVAEIFKSYKSVV